MMRLEDVVQVLCLQAVKLIKSPQYVIVLVGDPDANTTAFQSSIIGGHGKLPEILRRIADSIDQSRTKLTEKPPPDPIKQ